MEHNTANIITPGFSNLPGEGPDLIPTPGADTISGLGGNDWIDGGGGNDTVNGNTGDDWFWEVKGTIRGTGRTGCQEVKGDTLGGTTRYGVGR